MSSKPRVNINSSGVLLAELCPASVPMMAPQDRQLQNSTKTWYKLMEWWNCVFLGRLRWSCVQTVDGYFYIDYSILAKHSAGACQPARSGFCALRLSMAGRDSENAGGETQISTESCKQCLCRASWLDWCRDFQAVSRGFLVPHPAMGHPSVQVAEHGCNYPSQGHGQSQTRLLICTEFPHPKHNPFHWNFIGARE